MLNSSMVESELTWFSQFWRMGTIGRHRSPILMQLSDGPDPWKVTCAIDIPREVVEFMFTTKSPMLADFCTVVVWEVVSDRVIGVLKELKVTGL